MVKCILRSGQCKFIQYLKAQCIEGKLDDYPATTFSQHTRQIVCEIIWQDPRANQGTPATSATKQISLHIVISTKAPRFHNGVSHHPLATTTLHRKRSWKVPKRFSCCDTFLVLILSEPPYLKAA